MGYNRRAVNLHRCATRLTEDHNGRLPDDLASLLALPGIGPYTARAVLVFAFSMLEVSDSLILAQTARDYPITKQIYELSRSGTPESAHHAAALGVLGMALLAGTMGLAGALLGKRLGAIFRA